ncbi:MAG: hypothetical protein HYZ65_01545 [Burkholderiales bacterium]|nr:hypothetical protein [Burkholderiales bacterium]
MKKLILFSLLSALSLMTTAQTASDVETVTIARPHYTITMPEKTYRMPMYQFEGEFKGAYDLSNGMTLSLFNIGYTMYAKIGGQERHEIVATAADTFVARDRKLQMRIENHPNGDVSGEVLMAVSSDSLAKADSQVIAIALH